MRIHALLCVLVLEFLAGCGSGTVQQHDAARARAESEPGMRIADELLPGQDAPEAGPSGDEPELADSDTETVAMAEQLGLTVPELEAKKQMMMDAGFTPDEIVKSLAMGGDPASLFKDQIQSNAHAPTTIRELVFFRSDKDQKLKLEDHIGETHLVLVFTRGYAGGMICPFCATQTAQLAANYQEFLERDARVMIIYPGAVEHLADFAAAVSSVDREQADIAAVKWPVLLDPDLKAVNLLEIAANLAMPSTFIIDKQGNVVFAYVGANRTDRPSVQALLQHLDAI